VCVPDVELYRQAAYKENADGGFDVVSADTTELVTVSASLSIDC